MGAHFLPFDFLGFVSTTPIMRHLRSVSFTSGATLHVSFFLARTSRTRTFFHVAATSLHSCASVKATGVAEAAAVGCAYARSRLAGYVPWQRLELAVLEAALLQSVPPSDGSRQRGEGVRIEVHLSEFGEAAQLLW
ncbi:hypothetical protein EON66_08045 [archaeon]|nr:MAG: hypothetical protein EON66_08045 [archaeon]